MKLPSLATLALFTKLALAHFNDNGTFAVYWGQAEAGESRQNDLSFYCNSDSVDTVVLAFISQFGKQYLNQEENPDGFVLNLSNKCHEDKDGHVHCPSVANDIKTCQNLGKKVLISMGGESDKSERYGFEDDNEAKAFAQTLWDHFGEGSSDNRPFGTAVVDGFDFDIETTDQIGYVALANELRHLTENNGTKPYMFTAAPQCTLPEVHMSNLIENFEFDQIYVQFYNNKNCELSSPGFNYKSWVEEISDNGHDKTKVFIGLPSAKNAAASGFVPDVNTLYDKFADLNSTRSQRDIFGGFMFWDASRGFDINDRESYEKSYIFRAWSTFNDTEVPMSSSGASLVMGTEAPSSAASTPTPTRQPSNNAATSQRTAPLGMLVILLFVYFAFNY